MEKRTPFWNDPHLRRWLLQVLGLILLFALLGLIVWLFYDYQIRQMDKQKGQGYITQCPLHSASTQNTSMIHKPVGTSWRLPTATFTTVQDRKPQIIPWVME